jgi:hypothetical protein
MAEESMRHRLQYMVSRPSTANRQDIQRRQGIQDINRETDLGNFYFLPVPELYLNRVVSGERINDKVSGQVYC